MKARAAYRLIVSRGGHGPAWLAGPGRVDHVEIVDVHSGEVVLFWDLQATHARRLVRALREDLGRLDAGEFIAAWRDAEARSEDRPPGSG
ncbi:MAG: hypothetical protein WBC33_03870 [Conexibacter sp.]